MTFLYGSPLQEGTRDWGLLSFFSRRPALAQLYFPLKELQLSFDAGKIVQQAVCQHVERDGRRVASGSSCSGCETGRWTRSLPASAISAVRRQSRASPLFTLRPGQCKPLHRLRSLASQCVCNGLEVKFQVLGAPNVNAVVSTSPCIP